MTSSRATNMVSFAKDTVDDVFSLVGLETNIRINDHALQTIIHKLIAGYVWL